MTTDPPISELGDPDSDRDPSQVTSLAFKAAAFLGPGGPLSAHLANYEVREPQLQMAALVEEALAHQGIALCEAGTGTGKTLAYLVPALLSGQRVVVSTGTKTLQDQIMHHDLPLLRRSYFGAIDAACMKGLSNYLCLRRYDEFTRSAAAVSSALSAHVPALMRFADSTQTGDRADFVDVPDDIKSGLFAAVQSGVDTRIGPKCRFYSDCHVTRMRKRAAQSQLIVVNHHLLFADLALRSQGGGGVIPNYDALILDEAHLIEDVAGEFFGTALSRARIDLLLRDAEQVLTATSAVLTVGQLLADVAGACHQLFASLLPFLGEAAGRTPLPEGVLNGSVEAGLVALDDGLLALSDIARDLIEDGSGESVAQLRRRVEQLRHDVSDFIGGESSAHVLWTTQSQRNVSLGRSPVDVGAALREQLYARRQALVFTSATLSTSGDFKFIKQRLGIDFEVDELALPSPFDYAQCAALYLPQELPDYRDPAYQPRAVAEIEQLVALTGGGAFVLCTAVRAMRALHRRCQLPFPTFVQGEAPNHVLLQRFRAAGNGVLFATASFWQGIDVPGEALRLVIIDKLPFEVPSDPVVQARCARLQAEGQSAFMHYVVPAAALSLKQGFGRLIRHRSDRGVVAVLDRRLSEKGYGKVFLRSLPEARRCQTLAEVGEFWAQ